MDSFEQHPKGLVQLRQIVRREKLDVDGLAAALARELAGEVRFDDGARALYATDGSNWRMLPIGVVVPRDLDDVIATVTLARQFGAPILSRGGGTSLAGQCCNVAVVMDFSQHVNQLLELDVERKLARVRPGLVLDELRHRAWQHHLTFGPDPSTHNRCTLGGMIGNNSCGVHSVMAGRTADNVYELEILTYDGERLRVGATYPAELERIIAEGGRRGQIYAGLRDLRDRYGDEVRRRFPKIPRRVSGYNLDELLPENDFQVARALVGTEGTCVTVLEATLRLVDWPPARSLLVLGYDDICVAGDHVPEVMASRPIGCEAIDHELIRNMQKKQLHVDYLKLIPEGGGWLLVEFGGETKAESDANAKKLMDALRGKPGAPQMKLFDDETEETHIWKLRESGLGATARVPGEPDTWEGWEDSAVPPDKVGDYLRVFRKTFKKYGYNGALYGHFGQGCIHTRINFDLKTDAGIIKHKQFKEEMADIVVGFGGSLSGEHGDGQSRGELLPKMFGDTLVQAFREFKRLWDPGNKMNPGKVVDAYRMNDNLRLGTDYNPRQPNTWFQFPDDDGSMARATLRCVGVGECRRHEGGTMCPSYMVTREEMHSTRGRAHLLWEMLRGEELTLWKDDHVKEALDLCLACKGCKGECPVNVDLATYKAEFLAHYYEHRMRPRHAYAMGLIQHWARLASLAPGLANFISQTEPFSSLFKKLGGIAPGRRVPAFAKRTFKAEFFARPRRNLNGPPVLLWADTFNNHFFPQTAWAAVDVLESAGYRVIVPRARLCCGRPLYDFGMLDQAKRQLRRILDALKEPIEAGVPVIGLEPSCLAVFRDELRGLYPHDEDARRLREQSFMLGEFIAKRARDFPLPHLAHKAVVHGHCHHKSVLDFSTDEKVLKEMGVDLEVLDSGCCGMAGSFGFEKDKYSVSIAAGERVLLPKVREADEETIIVADGFSCREQIAQQTDRRALHLAEVMKLALDGAARAPYPERAFAPSPPRASGKVVALGALAVAAAIGLGVLALRRRR